MPKYTNSASITTYVTASDGTEKLEDYKKEFFESIDSH